MEREYAVGTKDDVTMFIGTEIEHTPAYGMETLFVVGIQDPDEIVQTTRHKFVNHVYLGANQSFEIDVEEDLNEQLEDWDAMINALIEADLWITLDFDVKYHTIVLESGYSEYDRFIPMISVKLPYINQLGYNACVKIDDTDFRKTNHGVWVHRVHDLQDTSKFTDWSKYTQDKVIK
jgi:hypothetical protein